jgi:hypothetical protein
VDKWGAGKSMRTIGALSLAIGFVILGGSALANEQVCPGLDSGKIDEPGNKTKVTVTAPDGQLIDQYCAKAGSAKQGYGPELVTVDPPQKSVTISHSSGKDLSHYSVSYVAVQGEPDPEPTEEPDPEPTDEPSPKPDEECEEEEEGDEEGEDEGEADEEGEEECEEPASEPTTPPTTPPATQTTTQTTTPPATQPVVVAPVVTEPPPKPLPDTDAKDEVKGVVITNPASAVAPAQVLPATLAFTGPRDQLPVMWALATLFLATGLTLRIVGGRRAKQSATW